MSRLTIFTIISVLLATAIFYLKKTNPTTIAQGEGLVIKKEWLVENNKPFTPLNDKRPADQTFLTFPEWYLVFSPAEQANYFKEYTATTFPFIAHTAQIWESYKIVNYQIKDNFPTNKGYHFMIWVIGTSATVEYAFKALYETLVGRITDTHKVVCDEDKFNAVFTQEYVDFIEEKPWYEFDFKSRLKNLWTSTSFFDSHFIRKMDRKYLLTSELLVKWIYGRLIGLGTKTVYEEALFTTAVLIDSLPKTNLQVNIVQQFADKSALVYLPRYHRFNAAAVNLAMNGCNFKEIAGNNSAILLTVIIPKIQKVSFESAQIVFKQPVASNLKLTRVALAIPVPQLSALLVELNKVGIKVEHIFDY